MNPVDKTQYDPEKIEKGICPKCGAELLATQALAIAGKLSVRWECTKCSFVTKVVKEIKSRMKKENPWDALWREEE